MSQGQLFATVMGAVVAGGVVLIAIAAGVAYYFRRHWAQWNTADPDNYEKAYQDSLASAAGGKPAVSSAERAAQTVSATDPTQHLDAVIPDGQAAQNAQSGDAAPGSAAPNSAASKTAVLPTDTTSVLSESDSEDSSTASDGKEA